MGSPPITVILISHSGNTSPNRQAPNANQDIWSQTLWFA